MELVPLKVKILRKVKSSNGKSAMVNDYPDFNSLDAELRDGMDWCYFIDKYGGWHYDKVSGFGEADDADITDPHNNPDQSCQYGCFLVPKNFAKAAIEKFPDRVFELSEEHWETFHDNRAHVNEPDEIVDHNIVNTINSKKNLGVKITSRDLDALNPDKSDVPGITRNLRKRWQDVKTRRKVTIVGTD